MWSSLVLIQLHNSAGVAMTDSMSKAKAVAHIKKNRLHITIAGTIDARVLEKLYTEIRFCIADLKQGFEVISDISQCNLIYITGLPVYKKIIDYLITNKVGEIVRIIKKDNISCKQIINFSEKIHCYRTVYADSPQEAEQKLENLVKRDGIRFRFNNVHVTYRRDDQSGEGQMVDISTSGCAIGNGTLPVSVGMTVEIILSFDHHQVHPAVFQMNAEVVRVQADTFAAHFVDLDEQRRDALYQRLAFEVSRIPLIL
jgi:hypothetical protein